MRQSGVKAEPCPEFVPGSFGCELREVGLGQLCTPVSSDFCIHIDCFLFYGANLQKIFENNK